jgi:hypothetical protein
MRVHRSPKREKGLGDTLSKVEGNEPACRQTRQTKQLTKPRCTHSQERVRQISVLNNDRILNKVIGSRTPTSA